jgi:putative DNA primase/helicase
LLTTDITVPALFRTIDARQPTVLFDEMDGLGAGFQGADEMQKILNAGFQRGRPVLRCVGEGSNQNVVEFDVFCPKAIAAIRRLPDTIIDRAFVIELKRKAQDEKVDRFRTSEVEPLAAPLRERAALWAEENLTVLEVAKPELPDELDDRGQDVAEPLLAIADLIGGEWPGKTRRAILELRSSRDEDDGDTGIRLLTGIEAAFDAANIDWLSTRDLVYWLTKDEASPWREFRNGRAITPTGVAKQLRYFSIQPEQHLRGGERARGYRRAQFDDVFARYLNSKVEPRPSAAAPASSVEPKTDPATSGDRPSPFLTRRNDNDVEGASEEEEAAPPEELTT